MKKFLSLILSLALVFTLTVPAFATETENYDAYNAAFDAAYDLAYPTGYAQAQKDAASGALTYTGNYELSPGFSAAEGTTDGQLSGYDAGYYDGWYDATGRDFYTDWELLDLGGVPGQVNVQIDGDMVQFPDAVPKIINGRTMIPARVIMEELGQDVTWNGADQTVTITDPAGTQTILLTIGSTAAVVTQNGTSVTHTLDVAPYIDGNDRTILPLRFLSETCGYTVLWDEDYWTAVVIDLDQEIAAIDAQFTALNKVLAANLAQQQSKNMVQTVTMQGSLSLPLDETGTMTAFPLSATATAWTDGAAMKMELSLDLQDLIDAFKAIDPTIFDGLQADLGTLLTTDWSAVTATVLLTQEGQMYFHCPLLNTLGEAPANTWFDLVALTGGTAMPAMSTAIPTDLTMGQLLAPMAIESATPIYAVETLDLSVQLTAAMLGDAAAKATGDGYTWTFDYTEPESASILTGKMFLAPSGKYDLSMSMDLGGEAAMTITGKGDNSKGSLTMKLEAPDLMTLDFSMTQTTKTTTSLPSFALPADAVLAP